MSAAGHTFGLGLEPQRARRKQKNSLARDHIVLLGVHGGYVGVQTITRLLIDRLWY